MNKERRKRILYVDPMFSIYKEMDGEQYSEIIRGVEVHCAGDAKDANEVLKREGIDLVGLHEGRINGWGCVFDVLGLLDTIEERRIPTVSFRPGLRGGSLEEEGRMLIREHYNVEQRMDILVHGLENE